ncbi:MAG: ATP-binding protein [bacterium]|nr:ATP-binding protein [bacterium]
MTANAETLHAQLILASRLESIEVAERALLDLCQSVGCGGEDEYWLVTALREALANAVRHGNNEDPRRKVFIQYAIKDLNVEIRVVDQGDGFNPEDVPDPTAPENLLRPSGRGIFYMRQFMSRVEFNRTDSGGTEVFMVRQLQPTTRSSENEERSP